MQLALAPAPPPRQRRHRRPEIVAPPTPAPRPQLLRTIDGAVIDIPVPILAPNARRWAATLWPDIDQPGGWGRAMWWPHPWRFGFQPVGLAYADIIEFGADVPAKRRHLAPMRWYGILLDVRPGGLLVNGPYSGPEEAAQVSADFRFAVATTATAFGARHFGL